MSLLKMNSSEIITASSTASIGDIWRQEIRTCALILRVKETES